ncbi:hypothetical protein MASR1M59_22700 [Melaminivora sp.]
MNPWIPGSARPAAEPAPDFNPLEQALRGPQAEHHRAQTLAQLDALELRLRQQAGTGLPPAQYQLIASALDACQAARETLTMPPGSPAFEAWF